MSVPADPRPVPKAEGKTDSKKGGSGSDRFFKVTAKKSIKVARLFKPEFKGKPVNFLATEPKVNLRSSPAVAPNNLVATVPRLVASLGKLGNMTGTIETVPGQKYFWIRLDLSSEVLAYFAVTFRLNAPKQAWVRSDVVHWKGAKSIVKRAAEKAVEPVKEVLDTTAEAAGDVVSTVLGKLWKPLLIGSGIFFGLKFLEKNVTKRTRFSK